MGIKDEFHQSAILLCIEELKTLENNKLDKPQESTSKSSNNHMLLPDVNLKRCEKCEKFLRSIPNQREYLFQGIFIFFLSTKCTLFFFKS